MKCLMELSWTPVTTWWRNPPSWWEELTSQVTNRVESIKTNDELTDFLQMNTFFFSVKNSVRLCDDDMDSCVCEETTVSGAEDSIETSEAAAALLNMESPNNILDEKRMSALN